MQDIQDGGEIYRILFLLRKQFPCPAKPYSLHPILRFINHVYPSYTPFQIIEVYANVASKLPLRQLLLQDIASLLHHRLELGRERRARFGI